MKLDWFVVLTWALLLLLCIGTMYVLYAAMASLT